MLHAFDRREPHTEVAPLWGLELAESAGLGLSASRLGMKRRACVHLS